MDRVRTPDSSPTLPPYSADGTAGYFATNTTVTPQILNQLTEEIRNAIIMGGATPDPLRDDQLAEVMSGVLCVTASTTDTGSTTQTLNRVVVGSTSSQSSGVNSEVVASSNSIASGARSVVRGSNYGYASGTGSFAAGGQGYEVHTSNTLALGWSASPETVVATGADQNLTIMANAENGLIKAAALYLGGPYPDGPIGLIASKDGVIVAGGGYVTAGGPIQAGTTVKAGTTITAGTGLTVTTGDVTVTDGDVLASAGKVRANDVEILRELSIRATEGWATAGVATVNAPLAIIYETGINWSVNQVRTIQVNNTYAPSLGQVLVTCQDTSTGQPIAAFPQTIVPGSHVVVGGKNIGSSLSGASITWRIWCIDGVIY